MTSEIDARELAVDRIRALTVRYQEVGRSGAARRYNEAQTVNDFILPLFEALGWDIHNRTARNEVLPEQAAATGRADWTFSLRGIPKMLVEAKRISADLGNPDFARQAITYSYSRGVTWAVLTNFRELKVYNSEWALSDPDLSRFLTFTLDQFETDFDRLWLLSRSSIEAGLLDAEAVRYGKKRTRFPVGEQLFSDLVRFRYQMRRTFLAYNPSIPPPEIDHAVQRLLDRLIFIRAAEDREIEQPVLRSLLRTLEQSKKRSTLWSRLISLFRDFERDYNSQLFEDQTLDHLETEIQPIWDTVDGLYGTPDGLTQFDFRGIDADVLGGVYEQYLGHLAKVDYEPTKSRRKAPDTTRAIRKAHGVYYTPRWMVRYIVHGALAPLLEQYTEDEVRRIRILDPACGSGSFLLEAFRVLANYWETRTALATTEESLALRLRILRENLFGIDLDPQAIEIAQLNLLLAALNQKVLLPDLTHNFAIGNALFDRRLRPVPVECGSDGWLTPIDTWAEFPAAMDGFDAVIMNPPYYDLQLHPYQQAALRDTYPEVASGRDDVMYYFLARAVDLCKAGGQLGCVVARYWLDSLYADKLRSYLASATAVRELIDFRSYQPFGSQVGVNAVIMLAEVGRTTSTTNILTPTIDGTGAVPQSLLEAVSSLEPGPPEFAAVQTKLEGSPWRPPALSPGFPKSSSRLADIAFMTQGIKTGMNDVYVVDAKVAKSRRLEPATLRPVLEGEDIGAYALVNTGRLLLYLDGSVNLTAYPNTAEYLQEHREALGARAEASRHAYPWWRLQRPRTGPATDDSNRLIAPQLSTVPRFSVIPAVGDLAGAVGLTDTVMIKLVTDAVSPYFLVAVLNSDYGNRWTLQHSKMKRGGYREFFATTLADFPVPTVGSDVHDLVVEYARQLQIEIARRLERARKGRFDDTLNAVPPRSPLIEEIDRLLADAVGG